VSGPSPRCLASIGLGTNGVRVLVVDATEGGRTDVLIPGIAVCLAINGPARAGVAGGERSRTAASVFDIGGALW